MSDIQGDARCAHEQRLLVEAFAERMATVATPADLLFRCVEDAADRVRREDQAHRSRRLARWFGVGLVIGIALYQIGLLL